MELIILGPSLLLWVYKVFQSRLFAHYLFEAVLMVTWSCSSTRRILSCIITSSGRATLILARAILLNKLLLDRLVSVTHTIEPNNKLATLGITLR
jgi:hypothetical protein